MAINTGFFKKPGKKTETLEMVTPQEAGGVSIRNALKAIYYLMASDDAIYQEEQEQYMAVGKALDTSFDEDYGQITAECRGFLKQAATRNDYDQLIMKGVEDSLTLPFAGASMVIKPKLLIWNLMTIAGSDGHFDGREKEIVDYAAQVLQLDHTSYLELESSFLTLMDLEKEVQWLKNSDKPYMTIETMTNEIADRKNVIFEHVQLLIAD